MISNTSVVTVQPVYSADEEPQHIQPHQPAVLRVQPVYVVDEEPLFVQPNQPAAHPVDDEPPDQQAQPGRSKRAYKSRFNSLNIDNL